MSYNVRIDLRKNRPTYKKQVFNPRHHTPQGQSVAKPETTLQAILVSIWQQFLSNIPKQDAKKEMSLGVRNCKNNSQYLIMFTGHLA